MTSNDTILNDEPTLVLLRRLGNDQRSMRGQLPQRLQAVRSAQAEPERVQAERYLAELKARMQAKQEELVATAAAMPDDVRSHHRDEVASLLAMHRKPV